jgi:uncharacterized membrane-anchored protein
MSRLPVDRPLSASPTGELAASRVFVKVPAITLVFWIVKVLTTGMGEAMGDYLARISIPLAAFVGSAGFVIAMWLQFRVRRYVPAVYWFAVAMVAVFGTMVADGLHVVLGVPYAGSTCFYAAVLAVVLWSWYRSEGTLSIHSIYTRRRETFYWLTVVATFALGTAAGDLTATTLHLGFLASGLLFTAAIAVPAIAWWRSRLNPVAAFWTAYILTRPVGASLADWFGKPHHFGSGLGFGDGTVSVITLDVFLALVAWLTVTWRPSDAVVAVASRPAGHRRTRSASLD